MTHLRYRRRSDKPFLLSKRRSLSHTNTPRSGFQTQLGHKCESITPLRNHTSCASGQALTRRERSRFRTPKSLVTFSPLHTSQNSHWVKSVFVCRCETKYIPHFPCLVQMCLGLPVRRRVMESGESTASNHSLATRLKNQMGVLSACLSCALKGGSYCWLKETCPMGSLFPPCLWPIQRIRSSRGPITPKLVDDYEVNRFGL
jgi:hypothetical protein